MNSLYFHVKNDLFNTHRVDACQRPLLDNIKLFYTVSTLPFNTKNWQQKFYIKKINYTYKKSIKYAYHIIKIWINNKIHQFEQVTKLKITICTQI